MIGISKLYCGQVEPSDAIRYGRQAGALPSHLLQFSQDKKPVIVWNLTRRCNLKCKHCYADAVGLTGKDEVSTEKAKEVIDDLADYGIPVLLFSGGEPLVRDDLVEIIQHARSRGIRAVISTNGLLLNKTKIAELKSVGLSYIGISIDGVEEVHDKLRGVNNVFHKTMKNVDLCREAGIKVGLRFTLHKGNMHQLGRLFEIIKERRVPRTCVYHLVYSGRGTNMMDKGLSSEETRKCVDLMLEETRRLFDEGHPKEILTVDNHTDGPYIWLKLMKEDPKRAEQVMELLQFNGGNNSGVAFGCISWDGRVHADQFLRTHTFGNVFERPFSEIWTDKTNELLQKIKVKKKYIKGRCSTCRFLNVCGGNFRARAESYYGDLWAPDPGCYLTDEEIAKRESDYF